jgi:acyl-CoA synthetase (AMP-forming)/AMP-acid ligase II
MTEEQIAELLAKYPWYEAARVAKSQSAPQRYAVDAEKIAEESEGEIISRFLRKGDYRIVAQEGEVEGDVLTEAEIDDYCLDLPRYKRPRKVIFAEVPRNPTGKIEKPKLRRLYGANGLVAQQNGLS